MQFQTPRFMNCFFFGQTCSIVDVFVVDIVDRKPRVNQSQTGLYLTHDAHATQISHPKPHPIYSNLRKSMVTIVH